MKVFFMSTVNEKKLPSTALPASSPFSLLSSLALVKLSLLFPLFRSGVKNYPPYLREQLPKFLTASLISFLSYLGVFLPLSSS